jgi:FtsP/CotA-like multicopper oxidase with cupredoxin domain
VHNPVDIEDESKIFGYDEERLLLIGDWYHHPADELLKKYLHWSSAGAEPVPDSFLVNGMGSFNCSMLTTKSGLQCTEDAKIPELHADVTKRYRFRVVNVG